MRITRRSAAVAASVGLSVGLVATPAFADTWTTSISGWSAGRTSAHWNDNSSGDTSIRMDNCRSTKGTFSNAVLTLWRQRGVLPDETRGDQRFYCYYNAMRYWTSPNADVYYFELRSFANQGNTSPGTFSANPVKVTW